MVMWDEIFFAVAHDYPDVQWDRELVECDDDAHGAQAAPDRRDGGVETARRCANFEPIHGSAFDITGKGIADPIATFWTDAMLEHLGRPLPLRAS